MHFESYGTLFTGLCLYIKAYADIKVKLINLQVIVWMIEIAQVCEYLDCSTGKTSDFRCESTIIVACKFVTFLVFNLKHEQN